MIKLKYVFNTTFYITILAILMFGCFLLMPTNNNQTLTSVNALSNEVWLGGVVTNVSSEKGSKSNPYQTFDEAKSAVA